MKLAAFLLVAALLACAQTTPVTLRPTPPPVAAAIPKAAEAKGVLYSALTAITGVPGATHGFVLASTPAPNTRIRITRRLNGVLIASDSVAAPPDTQPVVNRRTVRLNMVDLVGAPASTPDTFDFEYETLE